MTTSPSSGESSTSPRCSHALADVRRSARSGRLRKVPVADVGLPLFAKRIARDTELRERLTQVVSVHDPIHARTALDAAKRGVASDDVAPLQKLPDRRRRVERFR